MATTQFFTTDNVRNLVLAYEGAQQDRDEEYRTCLDQTEQAYCQRCDEVNRAVSRTKKAMEANEAAVLYYFSEESSNRRREWNREYQRRSFSMEDNY